MTISTIKGRATEFDQQHRFTPLPGASQNGLIRKMGFSDDLIQAQISMFERGIRQPSLPILAAYAKAANVYIEALITDDVYLPRRLPADSRSEGSGVKVPRIASRVVATHKYPTT